MKICRITSYIYPYEKRLVDFWIVIAGELFTRCIVEDELPVTYIPPIQLSVSLASTENTSIEYIYKMKSNLITSALKELAPSIKTCNILSGE